MTWIMIVSSILSIIVALIFAIKISQSYGVTSSFDISKILLFPLAILTGENLPRCFRGNSANRRNRKSLFSPGFAGNGLILLWTVGASFLTMAFLSNIRVILMLPVRDQPIDTTEDIFKQDKIPVIGRSCTFI